MLNNVKMLKVLFLSIACIYIHVSADDVFGSLKNIELYAEHLDEYPAPDNNDWENPDFTTYYHSMLSRPMYKLLKTNGTFKKVWTFNYFKSLLKKVTREREFSGYYDRFVMKMTPPPGARIVIFGEMHGAFHSLTRDLRALHVMGFIDENLIINDPDTYIVFNGNLASRSAHVLETLTLVLELMKKNPSHVIFIRGSQEDKEHWVHYSLKSALRTLTMYSDDKNFIKNEVNRFFNTLPLALYLLPEEKTQNINIVRISNYGTETKDISENELGDFFLTQEHVAKIKKNSQSPSKTQVNLKAIIRGDQFYRAQYIPSDGLQISGREEGAMSWTVLSSPTRAYQKLFDFYYDAFVVLTIYRALNDWTITLYNRNIKEPGDIKARKIFNLISGVELPLQRMVALKKKALEEKISFLKNKIEWVDESYKVILAGGKIEYATGKPIILEEKQLVEQKPMYWPATTKELAAGEATEGGIKAIPIGTDPKMITIGTMIDLTDGVREEGASIVQGIRAVFEKQNKLGGIYGKKLNLVFRDTKYSYEPSRENCKKLLQEDKVGVILVPHSTVGTEGLLDLVKERSILVLFPAASGARGIRRREFSNLFFLRASTITEGYILSKYVIEKLKAKKLAFFYENDTFGKDTLYGAILGLKELGIKDWIEVPFEPQDLNITRQVEKLRKSNIDALGCFGMQAVVKELFFQLGTQWLVNKKLFGSMDLSISSFRKYCERNRLHFVSTSVVPNPDLSDIEIVREYRRAVENMPPANDMHCLEAYIGADFFIHVLEQIGEPITVEKILTYLENVKNYSYKGLTFNFNPETRGLVHDLWLNTGAGDWQKISFEPSKSLLPSNVIQKSEVKKNEVQLSAVQKEETSPTKKTNGTLTVGSSMDLSRGVKDLGVSVKRGTELAFDNEKIPGIDISFIPMDDFYSFEQAYKNVLTLIEKNACDILLNPLGTPTFTAYIDLIKTGSIATFFPIPGIPFKRTREHAMKYCIYFRPSYEEEAYALIRYITENNKPSKVAFFYQNDAFGEACMQGVRDYLGKTKAQDLLTVSYSSSDVDFTKQVEQVKQWNADYIALFATPYAATQFLKQLGDSFVRKTTFFGVSDLGGITFQKMIKTKGIGIIISHVVPDPEKSLIPLVQEYRDRAKNAGVGLDTFSLEAYITTMIFIDVLKNIKKPINKDSIIEHMESLKNYNFRGILLNFDTMSRQLSQSIWINDIKGTWREYNITQP